MRISNFFQRVQDCEQLDLKTTLTVPDQSLSVRDILTRFSRGQLTIPDLDTGNDDDIDAELSDFDDMVDAMDSIGDVNRQMREMSIKNAADTTKSLTEAEQSEATVETSSDSE